MGLAAEVAQLVESDSQPRARRVSHKRLSTSDPREFELALKRKSAHRSWTIHTHSAMVEIIYDLFQKLVCDQCYTSKKEISFYVCHVPIHGSLQLIHFLVELSRLVVHASGRKSRCHGFQPLGLIFHRTLLQDSSRLRRHPSLQVEPDRLLVVPLV